MTHQQAADRTHREGTGILSALRRCAGELDDGLILRVFLVGGFRPSQKGLGLRKRFVGVRLFFQASVSLIAGHQHARLGRQLHCLTGLKKLVGNAVDRAATGRLVRRVMSEEEQFALDREWLILARGNLLHAVEHHLRARIDHGVVRLGGDHQPEGLIRSGQVDGNRPSTVEGDLPEVGRPAIDRNSPEHICQEVLPQPVRRLQACDPPAVDVQLDEARTAADFEFDLGSWSQPRAPHGDFRRAREVPVTEDLTLGLVDFDHPQRDSLLCEYLPVRIGHGGG